MNAREVRHNLRTPVTHVLGYTEMLIEDAESLGLRDELGELRQIHGAGRALLTQIDQSVGEREAVSQEDVDALRRRLLGPAGTIRDLATGLQRRAPESWARDLQRIGDAAGSLLDGREPEVSPPEGARRGGARILVADDNAANRDMLRRRLEREGYSVAEAENGRRALGQLRAAPCELVLLDVMMPEMDGFEVLEAMKEDAGLRDVPVIVISALDEMQSAARAIEMGAEDYLFRPFDPALLKARIASSLEKRRLRSELQVQERLASLGALTAGVAHEMKNPLNFVNNFAELSLELVAELKAKIAAPGPGTRAELEEIAADLEQNISKIREHGARADSVVRSMLLHSRGQSGERRPTDVNALSAEYVNLAYHGFKAQDPGFQVRIEMDLDPAAGMVDAVPQDLSRVFLNIASNALYALRRKAGAPNFVPCVSLRTRALDGAVEVRIKDNGPGIPPGDLSRIFEPFFTTKPAGEGTGLGLSLSYDIVVREHKGEIRAESREGDGAEFIVMLPRSAA